MRQPSDGVVQVFIWYSKLSRFGIAENVHSFVTLLKRFEVCVTWKVRDGRGLKTLRMTRVRGFFLFSLFIELQSAIIKHATIASSKGLRLLSRHQQKIIEKKRLK